MNNLTTSQKFQMALCVLGVFVAGTSQLEVLIGKPATTAVVAFCGLCIAMVSGIGAIVTGQASQLQTVRDMARVPNSEASRTVVQAVVDMARDPSSPVQGVITTATPEGKALAQALPGPIETAGSSAATDMAKP